MQFDTAVIFGAGAFGTSIASVLSENFDTIIVKVRSQDIYDSIMNNYDKKTQVETNGIYKAISILTNPDENALKASKLFGLDEAFNFKDDAVVS